MKFAVWLFTLGVSLLLTDGIRPTNALTRVRRANFHQFKNAHIMSPKTFNGLRHSPDPPKHWNEYIRKMTLKDSKIPGATPHNYNQRADHTFIVGSRKEVVQSVQNGMHLPAQGQFAPKNNLWESNRQFQQLQIQRYQNGPNRHALKNINDLGFRNFGAGVNNNLQRQPVHYQAKYNRLGPSGPVPVNNGAGGSPLYNKIL